MDNKLAAADAYVLALRTGEVPAVKQIGQYLASDVVLTTGSAARKATISGYDDVLNRVTGEWPNTPVFAKGFWAPARLDSDNAGSGRDLPRHGAR